MNDNSAMNNGVDHAGPHAVMHHQHCQMVDLLMQHCRRTMCGLNPHALPHAPLQHQDVTTKNSKQKQKDEQQNLEPSKKEWHTCRKKKGKQNPNKNKNQVKETNNFKNRFNRLQDVTKDMNEVTEILWETVKEQNNANNCEEKKENDNEHADEKNECNVDSVEINKLDEEIRKCVENEQSDNESMNKIVENANIEHEKNVQENIDDDSKKIKEHEENIESSDCSDNYGECDDDFYEEEFHSNSDSERSVESSFEKWLHRKTKWKEKGKRLSE